MLKMKIRKNITFSSPTTDCSSALTCLRKLGIDLRPFRGLSTRKVLKNLRLTEFAPAISAANSIRPAITMIKSTKFQGSFK